MWNNVHHHLFQFKILASKTGRWLKEIISCTVKVSKVKLQCCWKRPSWGEMSVVLKNSYSKWCARNMSFLMFMLHSHVLSTSNDRGLFVHEALRRFRTSGRARARTSQSMKDNGGHWTKRSDEIFWLTTSCSSRH